MERHAYFLDTIGRQSRLLFARHKDTGERITCRQFYGLPGDDDYERERYVLMTTAKADDATGDRKLF